MGFPKCMWLPAVLILGLMALAQNPATSTARPLSPTARLTGARTAYLKNAGGSEVPFNVVSEAVQGWGRYKIVNTPEDADIIIEVASPDGTGGVSVTGTTSTDPKSGLPVGSSGTTRELSVARITLIVYDSKSKVALWSSSEQPKGGLRGKTRKDSVVLTAQHLAAKFRERVEPESAK
jgi:predicted Zn-dependent protease